MTVIETFSGFNGLPVRIIPASKWLDAINESLPLSLEYDRLKASNDDYDVITYYDSYDVVSRLGSPGLGIVVKCYFVDLKAKTDADSEEYYEFSIPRQFIVDTNDLSTPRALALIAEQFIRLEQRNRENVTPPVGENPRPRR